MGQQREVSVKKFYCKGTIEERIMEVVRQRQEAVAVGGGGGAGAAGDDDDPELHGLHGHGQGPAHPQRTNVRMQVRRRPRLGGLSWPLNTQTPWMSGASTRKF